MWHHAQDTLAALFGHPYLKAAATLVYTVLLAVHGPWTHIHLAAVVFIIFDGVAGVVRSLRDGTYNPSTLRIRTVVKTILYGAALILTYQAGQVVGHYARATILGLPVAEFFTQAFGVWVVFTEWESIGRNVRAMGYKWPTIDAMYRKVRRLKSLMGGE